MKHKLNEMAKMQRVKSLMGSIVALMIISIQVIHVSARHVPLQSSRVVANHDDPMALTRRQDFDDEDDEMDSNASAPYQNQNNADGGQNGDGQNADGYEDAEPDGPYEETPREQEGQADMERFFDDHLGASERDGMDKENLPSNSSPSIMAPTSRQVEIQLDSLPTIQAKYFRLPDGEKLITMRHMIIQNTNNKSSLTNGHQQKQQQQQRQQVYSDNWQQANYNSENNSTTTPPPPPPPQLANTNSLVRDHKLFDYYQHQQQINGTLNSPSSPMSTPLAEDGILLARNSGGGSGGGGGSSSSSSSSLDVSDSRPVVVVATENDDDFDRVYVTNATNKPFRIEALGGFDPEQDFIAASMDINDQSKRYADGGGGGKRRHNVDGDVDETTATTTRRQERASKRPVSGRRRHRHRHQLDQTTDDRITTLDSDADDDAGPETLFEDASETDEITFGQEDPFQTDLEAEMRQQAFDKVNVFNADPNGDPMRKLPVEPIAAVATLPVFRSKPAASDHGQMSGGLVQPIESDNDDDDDYDKDTTPHGITNQQQRQESLTFEQRLQDKGLIGQPSSSAQIKSTKRDNELDNDDGDIDDEGKWAHDGVEDMEIPTQARQNQVLDRAVEHGQSVAPKRPGQAQMVAETPVEETNETNGQESPTGPQARADDVATSGDEDADTEVGEQRMPNADYLREIN